MGKEAEIIEVRAAREQDNEFFYLGYNPYPGKEPLKRSLANMFEHKPNKFYPNVDDSVTVEWLQVGFGFSGSERLQNFSHYVAAIAVPQLIAATDKEVRFSDRIEVVRLQLTDVRHSRGYESLTATRERLGSMSLFATANTSEPRALA